MRVFLCKYQYTVTANVSEKLKAMTTVPASNVKGKVTIMYVYKYIYRWYIHYYTVVVYIRQNEILVEREHVCMCVSSDCCSVCQNANLFSYVFACVCVCVFVCIGSTCTIVRERIGTFCTSP